jgi:hypothetical protein
MASLVSPSWRRVHQSGLTGSEYQKQLDSRNPAMISANASASNAATSQFNAETQRQQANSTSAASRAGLELQLAQMRAPSSYASIMAGADQQRDVIDGRYNSAMGDIQSAGDRQISDYLAMMEGMGDASRERIYRDATADRNSVGARLGATGLYNSTVLGSLQQGVNRNRNEAIGQLDEGLRREKSEYLTQLTSQALDRRQAMMSSQLGTLGNFASQRLSTDASLRGQERDTSSISAGLLNLISKSA